MLVDAFLMKTRRFMETSPFLRWWFSHKVQPSATGDQPDALVTPV